MLDGAFDTGALEIHTAVLGNTLTIVSYIELHIVYCYGVRTTDCLADRFILRDSRHRGAPIYWVMRN